jgi:hypothetical protein
VLRKRKERDQFSRKGKLECSQRAEIGHGLQRNIRLLITKKTLLKTSAKKKTQFVGQNLAIGHAQKCK